MGGRMHSVAQSDQGQINVKGACVSGRERPGVPGVNRQVSPQEGALSLSSSGLWKKFHFSAVAFQIELRFMVFSLSN